MSQLHRLALGFLALTAACSHDSGPPEPDNATLHITGTVTDSVTGAPLPGVTVGLWEVFGGGHPVTQSTTDAAGHYELTKFYSNCVNGTTTLVFGFITEPNCYYYTGPGAVQSPACTDAPQTFNWPLYRDMGNQACPWNSP